jgi:glycosyltransferase involved in cell wall biosynthesis
MDLNLPSVSVITSVLNCEKKLYECYRRLASQNYPKSSVELIAVDGGSTDNTRQVCLDFGARFIEGGYPDNQEARRWLAVREAKNDLLLILDSDNYLPDNEWLRQMAEPFKDTEIVAAQTLRYQYEKSETLMNRYFALFGANDPVAFYLKKADRLSYLYDSWNLNGKVIDEKPLYYKVEFDSKDLPTIGSNGFLIRKNILSQLSLKPEQFLHIDNNVDLINRGYNKYAIVKNSIIHSTGETYLKNISKRVRYMRVHFKELNALRRYKVFDASSARDRFNLMKFIFFSLTLIEPLFLSLLGYRKIQDRAWFMHPLVCLGFLFGYGYSLLFNEKA